MDCVNLKERFGEQYRVVYEESYIAQYGHNTRTADPWLQIILCHHGHIFPHGGHILAASSCGRGPTARKLAALPGVTIHQDGSDGMTVLFPVERFNDVAVLMKPRRRRRMTEAQRAAATARLAKYAFTSAHQGDSETQTAPALAKTVQTVNWAVGTQQRSRREGVRV